MGRSRYAASGKTKLGGLICNERLVDNERALVAEFASMLGTQLIYFISRNNVVQRAELKRRTVIQDAPDSSQAEEYRALAKAIDQNTCFTVPTPISNDALEELLLRYLPEV